VGPDQDKALELYRTMNLALASSLSALFGNEAQAFAISTFGKMLSAKLDLLQNTHGSRGWRDGLSPENTKALLLRLTRALQTSYRSIRIETNKGPKIVAITDIYTPARLVHRPSDIIDTNALIPDENGKDAAASRRALQNVTFSEFRDTFSRAIVLGDPGDISQAITAPVETCRELLGYMLTFGRAVLAFDGLDEILNTAQRREFIDLVVNFVDQFPLCPVLVTSRVIGYKYAPMPEDYDEFTLAQFNRNEVEHYLDRFFAKVFGQRKEDRPSQISRFMLQTETNAGDLRTNPLMLGLMAFCLVSRGTYLQTGRKYIASAPA
jgi:hypothetical protein